MTPDMDADSRNGSISLKTKPTFKQKFTTKGAVELEYRATGGSVGNEERFSLGGRLNEKGTLGGRLNFRTEQEYDEIEDISHDWNELLVDGKSGFVIKEMSIRNHKRQSKKFELGGTLDVRASEQLLFSARANYEIADF